MNKCTITFEEDNKKIVVDFTIDENDNADYNIRMEPEVKDKDEDIGLKGYLCQMFIDALHRNGEPEMEPDAESEN